MIVKEKVETYLRTHKRPVTARAIANHYLIDPNRTRVALKELQLEGKVQSTSKTASREKLWFIVRAVAVPDQHNPAPAQRPAAYNRPMQNSYPAIRGYDD